MFWSIEFGYVADYPKKKHKYQKKNKKTTAIPIHPPYILWM